MHRTVMFSIHEHSYHVGYDDDGHDVYQNIQYFINVDVKDGEDYEDALSRHEYFKDGDLPDEWMVVEPNTPDWHKTRRELNELEE